MAILLGSGLRTARAEEEDIVVLLAGRNNGGDPKTLFKEAIQRVDRCVVTPAVTGEFVVENGTVKRTHEPDAVLAEITGHATIAALVDALEFKPGFDMECECDGTHRLHFYSGARHKFTLSLHHWSRLRGSVIGPWGGDATLTENGTVVLLRWFSEHGFADLRLGYERGRQELEKFEQRRAEIAGLLPPEARSWLPRRDTNESYNRDDRRHALELAALFADKAQLLQTCWLVLGRMLSWDGSDMRPYGEPASFLLRAAGQASIAETERALSSLETANSEVALGALRHFASLRKLNEAERQAWLTAVPSLARHYYASGPLSHRYDLVQLLNGLQTPEADRLLLEIAAAAAAQPDASVSRTSPRSDLDFDAPVQGPVSTPEFDALFFLAKRRIADALPLLREALKRAPDGTDRTVLEIAAAWNGIEQRISERHLTCRREQGDPAAMAWQMFLEQRGSTVDATLLVRLSKAPNYRVREEAVNRLAAMGLEPKTQKEEAPERLALDERSPAAEIAATTAALAQNPSNRHRDALLGRRGRARLRIGDYAGAYSDLRDSHADNGTDAALAAFGRGRLDEAVRLLYRGNETPIWLQLRGCVAFARDNFADAADDFTAAETLSRDAYATARRHLAALHLGKPDRSRLDEWLPEFVQTKTEWPNALLFFLKGELSEAELLHSSGSEPRGLRPPEQLSMAYWTLAELARMKGDSGSERRNLKACVAAGACAALSHVQALDRLAVIEESERSLIP